MNKLSRRSFLAACSCSALALVLPVSPAHAAPSKTVILEAVKDPVTGKYSSVKVPADAASSMGEFRAAELEMASNRALKIAQSQNLSLPKANGLLTRLWRPSLRGASRGIGPALLEAGLVVGLTIALANATIELGKTASTLTMTAQQCAVLPTLPSDGWLRNTGIYRNSGGSAGVAIQRTRGNTTGGTVPAPAGWSWSAQRAISVKDGVTTWDVIFSKQVACGERIAFPPTVPEGAIPDSGGESQQQDQNSDANRMKVVDGLHDWAKKEQDQNVPIPGGEIPGEVEEPGIPIPPAVQAPAPPMVPAPPYKGGDMTMPRAEVPGAEDTHVKFPADGWPGSETGGETPGGEEPGGGGNSSGGIDWGTPPTGTMPTAPTPFAWVPTPWTAPDLPGTCAGLPYSFPALNASGTINPCPALDQARPVVRPVAILGWTVYAIAQFLDL